MYRHNIKNEQMGRQYRAGVQQQAGIRQKTTCDGSEPRKSRCSVLKQVNP